MSAPQVSTRFDPVYGRWLNRIGRTRAGFGSSSDKEEAVAAGRATAILLHGVLVVHNEDGTIAHRESYTVDPATD